MHTKGLSGRSCRALLVISIALIAAPRQLAAQTRQPARAAPATMQTFEGESLLGSAHANAGRLSAQAMNGFGNGWSADSQLLWSGASKGAVLDIGVNVTAPAVYAIELYFTRAPDYAQIGFAIDGNTSSATLDSYAPRVAPPAPYQAGTFALTAGPHTLSLMINGKHGQSSGYLVGLDQIKLYPTAPLSTESERDARAVPSGRASSPAAVTARNTPIGTSPRSPVEALPRGSPALSASRAPPGSRSPPGSPAQSSSTPGGDCASSCLGSVSTVYRKTEQGQCSAWFRVPCDPYGCEENTGMCRSTCANDTDCGEGSSCSTTTGLCSAAAPRCTTAYAVMSPNRQVESCEPYKCRAGACRESCTKSNDCAKGYACNAYGRCTVGGK